MAPNRARLIGMALVLSASAGARAASPSFTPLGDLQGGNFYSAVGAVSADGSIVAGWSTSSCIAPNACNNEMFRWESGVMTGLGFPASSDPAPYSGAQAMSANGSILAGSGSSDESSNEPFRWEAGVFTPLGRIPGYGGNAHLTTGMSNDGQRIVGWGVRSDGWQDQAWLWENGVMTGLGYLPNGPRIFSHAYGVSGNGNVVVGVSDGEAFRWSNGIMSGLGFLPNPFSDPNGEFSISSDAQAASLDGTVIAGTSGAVDYSDHHYSEAFRWSGGAMIGIGDLPGGEFDSSAVAMSDDGAVIIGMGSTEAGREPFIWDADHGMRRLRDVLTGQLGLNLVGWTLQSVSDVSADGSVIVGTGINPNGEIEAFRAVIPEPAALSLLAIGLLPAGIRLRRRQR